MAEVAKAAGLSRECIAQLEGTGPRAKKKRYCPKGAFLHHLPRVPLFPAQDGTPDLSKGSFYFNPVQDTFADVAEDVRREYPTFYGTNVFPTEVEDFEPAMRAAAALVISVGARVAAECDLVVQKKFSGQVPEHAVEDVVRKGKHHAARVLHYFARQESGDDTNNGNKDTSDEVNDNWCGWHNDHCVLTGLVPGGYHDDATGQLVPNPDPKRAGLHIKTRQGHRVHLPPVGSNSLLFQIGETAQVLSGGVLKATPHMVAAAAKADVSRSTLAVFMEPGAEYIMTMPADADAQQALRCEHLPPGVPVLSNRWKPGINFGDFSRVTFASYYN